MWRRRGAGTAEAMEPQPHFQGGTGTAMQVLVQTHNALAKDDKA